MWEIHHIKLLSWRTPKGAFCPRIGEAGRGCSTRLPNTHSTAERRVLYEFHPWFGRQVTVDDVFVRAGISVARCRPPGEVPGHLVEVPLWMLDRQSCSVVRRRERPHVDLTALEALSDMLSLSGGGDGGDSAVGPVAAGWDADLQSRDPSQGANHAPIPSEARAARPVRPPGPKPAARDATMAQSATGDEVARDGSGGPDAVATPRQPVRGAGGREHRGGKLSMPK